MNERHNSPLRTALVLMAGLAAGCGDSTDRKEADDPCPGSTLSEEVDRVLRPDAYENACGIGPQDPDNDGGDGLDCTEPQPLPRLSIALPDYPDGSYEGDDASGYTMYYIIRPFNERAIPGFENECSALPELEVRVRAILIRYTGATKEGGKETLTERIIARGDVYGVGEDEDFIECSVPPGYGLSSFRIEVAPRGAPDDSTSLAATRAVQVINRGPAMIDCPPTACPEEQEGETPTAEPAEDDMQ